MNRIYYAKSDTKETIQEHTDKLLNNLKILKQNYGEKIVENEFERERFFYLLEIVCKYHDIGKVYTPFQNIILEKIGEEKIKTSFDYTSVKHEQLSPMFVPINNLDLTKDEKILVYQAIFYHHEREYIEVDNILISKIINEDFKPQLENIKSEILYELNDDLNFSYYRYVKKRIKQGDELYIKYCLLKGLLHRLDHCSSQLADVEEVTKEVLAQFTENSMVNKGYKLNELQKYGKNNKNKNILVIGSTGIGKTEGALIWSDCDKTFFTLPLRVSINAIFDRINKEIDYNHVGLLHSTAIDYLEENYEFENPENEINLTRNLSKKITTCTIDQIFPFVFKYKGYEKIYATLKYSKIIIDEIQGYSPEIVAVILKGIQMINNIGGKFMIMTATLPRIYKEELEKMGIDFEYNEFIKDTKRHFIKLEEKELIIDIDCIREKATKSKVLVIANTVDKAIQIYNELTDKGVENVNLFHSRFILEDRNNKENEIKEFSKDRTKVGVWITTQIVEASLDIDFDYLYTEMSTLDSLFQRMGRCFRKREYKEKNPNIYIYTENVSGIGSKSVYNKQIHENSINLLKDFDNKILDENSKIKLVDKLYSNDMLDGTEFIRDFKEGMNVLNRIIDYDVNKKEAQKLLRNIENITVIPKCIYEDKITIFEKYKMCSDKTKKRELKKEIMKLTTSISLNQKWKLQNNIIPIKELKDKNIMLIDMYYDENIGLKLNENMEENWDKRSF